jgi:HlyD family secretion protein
MEPTNKSFIARWFGKKTVKAQTAIDFLPDADEMERSPLPPIARLTIHILAVGLLCAGIWANFSQVEKIVVAQGRMVNPAPNVVLQPLETSIIRKIEVRPGQVVKKGDVLATLDPTFVKADEEQLRGKAQTLELQAQTLRAELDGTAAYVVPEGSPPLLPLAQKGNSDKAVLDDKAAAGDADGNGNGPPTADDKAIAAGKTGSNGTDSQIQNNLARERLANYRAQKVKGEETFARVQASLQTNQRDQQVLGARLRAVREIENMQEKLLASQYGAKLRLLEAQDKRLEIERDLMMARNREVEIKSELSSLQADGQAFEKGWRQKLTEELLATTRELDGVNEQLHKANLRHKLVTMTSPIDAVVLEIAKLSVGSVVREAETFFTLVPISADLEAEVQIDSLDVGYIKPGDKVHLKLDAFPFQKHGVLEANIRSISEDAFRRENPQAGGGLDAYYRAQIKVGSLKLKHLDSRNRLLPGMTLSAEIVVGRRSVMSYLVWPLTKALDEAIREP